jgi:hypothetical protein
VVTTKAEVLVENLLAKAEKLVWRVNHEHSYIASLGGYKITVSKDLLGYIVTLTDEDSEVLLSAREKGCKTIYEKAMYKALDVDAKMQQALRILETL